jgi:hypothetical protein
MAAYQDVNTVIGRDHRAKEFLLLLLFLEWGETEPLRIVTRLSDDRQGLD